jgi:hypothetical protein
MSDAPFHDTRMGRVYYEVTLPKLVQQLERLNENLERINATLSVVASSSPQEDTLSSSPSDHSVD